MSELLKTESKTAVPDQLKAQEFDEANDRFSLIRAQEGGAILRRYNASIAAVRAGLGKVPTRYRETTTAAVQAYMRVAHDTWNQMLECENNFGRARRLQMDAQMHFAQSTNSFMAQSEGAQKGLLSRVFQRRPQSPVGADARSLAIESASDLRAAIDQQTDALMKHNFLQGEFERTLNEMAQIVQQHMVSGLHPGGRQQSGSHGCDMKDSEVLGVSLPPILAEVDNESNKAKLKRRSSATPVH